MSDFDEMSVPGARLKYWPAGPAWDGVSVVALGAFAFDSVGAGADLLRDALARAGDVPVLGPIDGDTWHPYRAVTESDGSAPFLLEPRSGPHDLAALQAAGFAPVAGYASTRMSLDSAQTAPRPVEGVSVTAWDGKDAAPLLDRLFAMAGASFADKQFYKPITRDDFLSLYLPLLPMLDPRLVLFAVAGDAMVGFLLGYRDPGQPTTAVLKTYAAARHGVGHLLAHEFHERARSLGCDNVIHALMHEENISLSRSGLHGATVFRRYALFGHRPG